MGSHDFFPFSVEGQKRVQDRSICFNCNNQNMSGIKRSLKIKIITAQTLKKFIKHLFHIFFKALHYIKELWFSEKFNINTKPMLMKDFNSDCWKLKGINLKLTNFYKKISLFIQNLSVTLKRLEHIRIFQKWIFQWNSYVPINLYS